ncbi:ABC transporter six-transmembrane domain-containing protein [Comamonas testosteroni]|uniref:ABC transporter six-transmembrane domain-containing protein n=1 Tax=Comamonas testosteroni TaxID=285 RepID=UPI0009B8300F|nr:ABC transporter six-transmembrane domain-containing protein [Comamonas testosteroni]
MSTSNDTIINSQKIGIQSAKRTLITIAKENPAKLALTFGLVGLENILLITYPLFAGYAVNSILNGDVSNALIYVALVFAVWLVGATRRAVDTRVFTRIYAWLAVPVVLNQRQLKQSASATAARVVLAREFVDFFEKQIPAMATALISILGAVAMLLFLEPLVGAACLAAMVIFGAFVPSYAHTNEVLHQRLNNRLEKEVRLVADVGAPTLLRHYSLLSRLRIRLSDREAGAFLATGIIAAILFALTITRLTSLEKVQAGHVYSVLTYLWTFVITLDESPGIVDQVARLRDIGKRVSPSTSSA